jgi:UDP-glucuronate decarboxylase
MSPDDGRVVSNFIVQALRGEDITVYGDGTHTRSFCSVHNLVDAIVRLMDTPPEVTGPVNLGNPAEITIIDLARKVLEITRSKSKLVSRPVPEDDPVKRKPDISLARELLGWEPTTTLDEGLKETIAYFREILGL